MKPLKYSHAQFDTGGQKKWNKPIKRQNHYTTDNAPELTLKAHKATCLLTCVMEWLRSHVKSDPEILQRYLSCPALSNLVSPWGGTTGNLPKNAGACLGSSRDKEMTYIMLACNFRHPHHPEMDMNFSLLLGVKKITLLSENNTSFSRYHAPY